MADMNGSTYCDEALLRAAAGEADLYRVVDAALRVVETNGLPDHADIHENGGRDEINVGGLAGLLADAQNPLAHAAAHAGAGADPILTLGAHDITGDAELQNGVDLVCAVAGGSNIFSAGTPGNAVFTRGSIATTAAGVAADWSFRSGLLNRWIIRKDGTAETGGNAGSNFAIVARTDAGAFIDNAMTINRAAGGLIYFNRNIRTGGVCRANGGFNDNGAAGLDAWIDDGVNFRATFSGGILTAVVNSIAGGHG